MKNLFVIILLAISVQVFGQTNFLIKEVNMNISMPNDEWKLQHERKHKGPAIYHFKRNEKRSEVPEVMVVAELITPGMDLKSYSLNKQKPYQNLKEYYVEKVFTDSDGMLKLPYAIGNKAFYVDDKGVLHTFYFIHAVKGNRGIQVIINVHNDLFKSYEEELTAIIRSLEYK